MARLSNYTTASPLRTLRKAFEKTEKGLGGKLRAVQRLARSSKQKNKGFLPAEMLRLRKAYSAVLKSFLSVLSGEAVV